PSSEPSTSLGRVIPRRGSWSYKVPLNGGIAPQDLEREQDRTQGDEHPCGDAEPRAVRTDGNRDQQTAQDDEEQSAELLDPEHGASDACPAMNTSPVLNGRIVADSTKPSRELFDVRHWFCRAPRH